MAILKSSVKTYEFSLDEIKKLIASDLDTNEEKIHVEYVIQEVGGDFMDRFPGTKQVTKIKVDIKE